MISFARATPVASRGDGIAADHVIAYVRDLIAQGLVTRGQRLPPERELVRAVGVSRTTVRAGLQSLASKGVLVIRHGAGTFVANGPPALDSEPLRLLAALHGVSRSELFDARRTLHVRIAGLAAEQASPDDLATISDEVASLFASLDRPSLFAQHDVRFHHAIAAASGNRILTSLLKMVSDVADDAARPTAASPRELRGVADMCRQLYQAIRDRDRARAERIMSERVTQAERVLR